MIWKNSIIKHYMLGNIDVAGCEVHANVSFLKGSNPRKRHCMDLYWSLWLLYGLIYGKQRHPKTFEKV